MAEAWYVARVKSTISWDVIIQNLARQEFSSYVPIVQSANYFAGKKTITQQPLFPNYIFVLLDLETMRWRAVNSTVGVIHLLPAGAEIPRPVPTGFVDELKLLKPSQPVMKVVKTYLANEIVRFIAGPLSAQRSIGRVISSNAHRTRVELPLMGRETVVTVPTDDLGPIRQKWGQTHGE